MFVRLVTGGGSRAVIGAAIVLAILAVLPVLVGSKYYVSLLVQVCIWALFAMSLDLLVGYLGHASFGHAAFFGGAAYAMAIFNVRLGWDFVPAGAGALLVTLVVGLVFGLVVSHISGVPYTMVNFALAQVLWGLAYQWNSMSGGDNGIRGVARPVIGGLNFTSIWSYYYLVLAVFIVCTLLLLLLVSSPFGLSMRGIKQTQSRMRVLGYNVWLHKYIAYVIAGMFAGIAGVMQAAFNSFVGPGEVGMLTSAKSLLMVLVGGTGTLLGPILGAVAVVLMENVVSAFTDRWLIVLGFVYITVVVFLPGGLIKLAHRLVTNPTRRPAAAPAREAVSRID